MLKKRNAFPTTFRSYRCYGTTRCIDALEYHLTIPPGTLCEYPVSYHVKPSPPIMPLCRDYRRLDHTANIDVAGRRYHRNPNSTYHRDSCGAPSNSLSSPGQRRDFFAFRLLRIPDSSTLNQDPKARYHILPPRPFRSPRASLHLHEAM